MRLLLLVLAVQLLLCAVSGELNRNQKQILLDLTNIYRASNVQTAVRLLEWSSVQEQRASAYVKDCDAEKPPAGVIQFYNISSQSKDDETRLTNIFEQEWGNKEANEANSNQLLFRNAKSIGCAEMFCERLPFAADRFTPSASFIACAFDTTFFGGLKEITQTICSDKDGTSNCPEDAKNCFSITSQHTQVVLSSIDVSSICSQTMHFPLVPSGPTVTPPPATTRRVSGITPRFGSTAGGQEITLSGEGFSGSNLMGSNEVYFTRGSERIPCDVRDYSSSSIKIVCITRASTVTRATASVNTYNVEVYVTLDGVREQVTDFCTSCTYVYHYYALTPIIQNFIPFAATFDETVTTYGKLYANSFADVSDSDSDEAKFDHFSRLLVGGMPCDHNPLDNTTNYTMTLDDNGQYGSVECRPTSGYNVGAKNVTIFLEDRGASAIDDSYNLLNYDNKFQPYHFVLHADILDVSPRGGSRAGGTRISVTLNMPLREDDLETLVVNVGGTRCTDLTLLSSYDNSSVIQCTTGPEPSPTAYYPGGRGWQRELWTDGGISLSRIVNRAKSDRIAFHERAFLHSAFVSDFGELNNINHRFTGFFVPPVTSLYTFGIRSDDASAFYLSNDSRSENLPIEATSLSQAYSRNSWTFYPQQTSEPVLLEGGKYYYFKMVGNQGTGPWEIALGAKVHNLSYNARPYIGDNEEQLVAISSTVVKEENTVSVEARPLVQTLTLTDPNTPADNCTVFCPIPLSLGSTDFPISRDMTSEALEELLNGMQNLVGTVKVYKDFYDSDQFAAVNARDVKFTIVYLTTASDVPMLSLNIDSAMITCDHTNTTTDAVCGDYNIVPSIETTQELNVPSDFTLGFTPSNQPPRYTQSLPLDATEDTIHSEISDLFGWGCDSNIDDLIAQNRVFYSSSLEASSQSNRDNSTSFCGHYSERNPGSVWRSTYSGFNSEPFNPDQYRYLCFAYSGTPPSFRVIHSYTNVITMTVEGNSVPVQFADNKVNVNSRINECLFSGPLAEDGWTAYQCVDVRECLQTKYPDSRDHRISRVYFNYNANFWVDDFAISSSEISAARTQQPVRPNDVSVLYVEVAKAMLTQPELIVMDRTVGGNGGAMELERDFSLLLSTVTVTYTVRDCGNGLEPLVGYYGNKDAMQSISVEQTAIGSLPVNGTFDLKFMDEVIAGIPFDVDAATMKMLLEAILKNEGGFEVERNGLCSGYNWNIRWATKGGDLPLIEPDWTNLKGDDTMITVTTLVDGGTWLRPIGGEMLRLPMDEPQIEVIIDGTPSSCRSGNCSFTYESNATPTLNSVYPVEGQGGNEITIYGSGFCDDISEISVTVGKSSCSIVSANATQITCTLANHPAGYYDISVLIEGKGMSVSSNVSCFRYLLTVDSVSPVSGGVGGGSPLTITGNGFMDYTPLSSDNLGEPFSFLPWFKYGLGVPSQESARGLRLCPLYRQMLLNDYNASEIMESMENFAAQRRMNQTQTMMMMSDIFVEGEFAYDIFMNHLLNLYNRQPSSVLINEVPCIITESTVLQLICVPLPTILPKAANITVSVLSETATLLSSYETSLSATPLITGTSPLVGAVTGGTMITISGRNFGASSSADVSVTIRDSVCNVQFVNDTVIECITSGSRPSYAAVLVKTPNGVAVLESAYPEMASGDDGMGIGMGMEHEMVLFPIFRYKLIVYADSAVAISGSVFGGSEVTIQGGIFAPGQTQVFVGRKMAEIVEVTMDTITFQTPSSSTTHYIELMRSQFRASGGIVTVDFSWSTNELEVQIGDTIIWKLSAGVRELASFEYADVSLPLSPNAQTTSRLMFEDKESSLFQVTFDIIGSFALTGLTNQQLDLPEFPVNVTGPRASYNTIEVSVGDDVAIVIDRNTTDRRKRAAACVTEEAPETSGLFVEYSPCLTPSVTNVEPSTGFRLVTEFTITGYLFSTIPSNNEVTFGGYACTPITSNETTITCIMSDPSSMPPTFTSLPVSVNVASLGEAYVVNTEDIILQSYITEISPAYGSLKGGNDVSIAGDGFPTDVSVTVYMGSQPCTVNSVSYDLITCSTVADLDSDLEVLLSVSISLDGTDAMQMSNCMIADGCNFTFSDVHTPKINSVSPLSIASTEDTTVTISGSGFLSNPSTTVVMFGDTRVEIMESTETTITALFPPQPANTYPISVQVCASSGNCSGNAQVVSIDNTTITSVPRILSVYPPSGSVQGGTEVTITGRGFNNNPDNVEVTIGTDCNVQSVNYSTIICVTSSNNPGESIVEVSITALSTFPDKGVMYTYSMESTPAISGISPTSGNTGTTITLTGTGLGAGTGTVTFGDAECTVSSITETDIVCETENNFVGTYTPNVVIGGMGMAAVDNGVNFTYTLNAVSVTPSMGSYAGLSNIVIEGSGFNPADIDVTVCGLPCDLTTAVHSVSRLECILPPMDSSSITSSSTMSCDVVVSLESSGESDSIVNGYTYRGDLTARVSDVNRTRGGSAGGSILLVTGQGFSADAIVTIAGSVCVISSQTDTQIVCTTGASGRNVRAVIMVFIQGQGFALSDVEFWYVDLWSSPFTWQGGIIPEAGDLVEIPRGQTLVLDVVTPILGYIVIRGGTLIFDPEKGDNEVGLHTQGGIITGGGVFQVGTEDEPYRSKTEIVLYGHVLSTELPVYGAKTLALREGTLDIHGRTLNLTWTRLSATVAAGSDTILLQEYIDWDVGGTLVIASTSFSQRENEERIIESITAGERGSIIKLTKPLDFEHISIQQTIDGRYIDTSAEVGYLTRNVVIRGNRHEEWVQEVPACPEEFRTGQFDLQTCFLGRFGAETINDQFGSQVMIHAPAQNEGLVAARFGYVEVTHAGQAFRLGRYPIHFHLNGNVTGSYVRGCGIHHTFNRAITMHSVDYLLVEKNVAFNIMGHAYFTEDGNEQFNTIQDNLGIFVRASSSLLNVDITPATFWVVNPNNIVRRNAAAGGTHFGFWYRLPKNPEGPSFDSTICPRRLPLGEFSDNSAHSFGWYGLWVFREYHPSITGNCWDSRPSPAYYDRFLAWRNDKGVEFEQVGSLQLRDSIMMDNTLAGVEITDVSSDWSGENDDGPLVKDTLIVGYSAVTTETQASTCSQAGIKTPHSYYLTVSNVTFANFNRPNCYPVQPCSFCRHPFQGGFETRFKQIKYINRGDDITKWNYFHEHAQRDLDGTLSESGDPSVLVASSNLYRQGNNYCRDHAPSSTGSTGGMICNGDMEFGRIGVHDPLPSSLTSTQLNFTSEYGTDQLPFEFKRFRGGPGQMAIVPLNSTYQLTWVDGTTFTNITYSVVTAGFEIDDYVLFQQSYPRPLDFTSVRGVTTASNVSELETPATANTGDWAQLDNVTLLYIVKGTEQFDADQSITFSTYRCFYENCIPPPPPTQAPLPTIPPPRPEGRPDDVRMWSNSSIWPNNQLPQEGEDVFIDGSLYVVVDMALPRLGKLIINGGFELDDSIDHMIEADFIIVDGGRFAIGYPDTPFQHEATVMLHGGLQTEELNNRLKRNFFTNIGAKALAVFGDLFLHGVPPARTWTTLAATAMAGTNTLQLSDSVNWKVGVWIVITSTSYDAYETEVLHVTRVISDTEIEISGNLANTHSGGYFSTLGADNTYTTRAEVGLLTRNIVITNDDNDQAETDAFGCRVVVSQSQNFMGKAQIQGVEFRRCGQLGYTDDFDPRYSLAILNLDDSYVRDCSINEGYNVGIGVYDSSRVVISGNVIYNTVGESIIARGSEHNITDNLGSLSRFIGTFRRVDDKNIDWTSNFEVTQVSSLRLTGNAAAGGAKVGFHTNGEDCTDSSTFIRDNTAHSVLHGIHLAYSDGLSSGCSRFSHFNIFNCYFFGIFSYSSSGIQVFDSTFTNNRAAVYSSTIGPGSISHRRGTKTNKLQNVLIISAGMEFTCDDEDKRPAIADHPTSHDGIRSRTGGHLGIIMPNFLSGSGHFPQTAWWTVISYPAIAGLTEIDQVTFANFHMRCGTKLDTVMMSHPGSDDANHPIHLSNIAFVSDTRFNSPVNADGKLFVRMPNIGRVNPSDCVDMDCDGFKQVLIKDIGGTFTETNSDRSIISFAEFEWDGNMNRGVGDFRIPKTMLTRPDGSRIPVDDIYPRQGIPRSLTSIDDTQTCEFNSVWNMYVCRDIEHIMLVLESLDADTEVRRLSPIGIGANGYINLINGPQDHGWCGGYTCQERISTFFSIVATGLHYTVALTSTNPQDFALYMLNAREDQSIVTCLIYTNPQRLDVYHNGDYVVPKNAEMMEDGNLRYLEVTSSSQFVPLVTDPAGSNYYDRNTKQLCITLKGDGTYSIDTTPVIVLSINVQVTVDTFFDDATIVRNIALLLGIPANRIRVVSATRETSRRKRQQGTGVVDTAIEIEIGDPPQTMIVEETPTQSVNMTGTGMNMTDSGTGPNSTLSIQDLVDLSEQVVNIVQTGEIITALNVSANLTGATINEPEAPPVDETGGVRATPSTGGPQPEEFINSTEDEPMTFSDIQRIEDEAEQNETVDAVFSIPTSLQIVSEPGNGANVVEGVRVGGYAPTVRMLDNNGQVVVNLGLQIPWVLTIEMISGPDFAFIVEYNANFTLGVATFADLIFSHPGEYVLSYRVSYPDTANFGISSSQSISVQRRQLGLVVNQQPLLGNTTFILYPYPSVSLVDMSSGSVVEERGWRNNNWTVVASVRTDADRGKEVGRYEETIEGTYAVFRDIEIKSAGDYVLLFEAYAEPAEADLRSTTVYSDLFTITQRQITKLDITYDVDFNTTIGDQRDAFITAFLVKFRSSYPQVEIINVTLTEGSIIVGVTVTAVNPVQLSSLIAHSTASSNFDNLQFIFNGTTLTPFNVTQDPAFPVVIPTLPPSILEEHFVLILAIVIPGVVLIVSFLFMLVVCCCVCHHKKNRKSLKLENKVSSHDSEEKYVSNNRPPSPGSVTDYYLLPDRNGKDVDTQSFESHELNSLASTPVSQRKTNVLVSESVDVKVRAKSIKTPDVFFANPSAEEALKDEKLETLDTNFDEVVHLPTTSQNIYSTNTSGSTNNNTVAYESRTPSAATVAHSLLPPPSAMPSQSSESTKVKKYESMKVEDIEN